MTRCALYTVLWQSLTCRGQTLTVFRVSYYERYVRELNLTGLKFPIGIDQIPLFEKDNTDYSVTVMSINADHDRLYEAYTPCMPLCVEIANTW